MENSLAKRSLPSDALPLLAEAHDQIARIVGRWRSLDSYAVFTLIEYDLIGG